mgnify:CR=1 FL=1
MTANIFINTNISRRINMAFDSSEKKKIQQALGKQKTLFTPTLPSHVNTEKTKNYQFTLQPPVREKLNQLAKQQGYKSASSFLNELIKGL